MGTGLVTIAGVDRTALLDQVSASIEEQANRLNGVFGFYLEDPAGLVRLREAQEVLVTDDGTRIYGGRIVHLEPQLIGTGSAYVAKCASFDVLLDDRVIENGLRSGPRTDAADVAFICGHHAELDAATYVSTLRPAGLGDVDYSGLRLRKALDKLAVEIGGATYWVDELKKVHWTDPASAQLVRNGGFDGSAASWALHAAAAFGANDGPGGVGDGAVRTTGSGAGMHESSQTVTGIVGNRRYLVFFDLYASIVAHSQVRLDWQNAASVSQRIDVVTGAAAPSAWERAERVYTAPAAATKVVIRLGTTTNSAAVVRHDNVNLVGETAAYGIHTTPDGVTTRAPIGWREPSDATKPVNRVLVRGNGISGWREHAASIAYFGRKFEDALDDERVTTEDGISSRANWLFRKAAFPARSGSYRQTALLRAGTWQVLEIQPYGIRSIVWIAAVRTRFDGAGQMEYEVTYGQPEEDVAAAFAAVQSAFAGEPQPSTPAPGEDTMPPAVPTGLTLVTGTAQAPDGTLRPYLQASWTAVTDGDLDAYELQLDRAIVGAVAFTASASGVGGSALPAGTYDVKVTGVGAAGGETAGQSSTTEVVLAAGQRLFVNITAKPGCSSYRVYAQRNDDDPGFAIATSVTGANVEVTAEGAGAGAPSVSTAVSFANPTSVRTGAISHYTEDVVANTWYGARLRAIDVAGNESAYTAAAGVTAGRDTGAPSMVSGLSATPGFRLVGLSWQRSSESDLDRYEVRWAPDNGAGAPETTTWQRVSTSSNWIVLTGLTAGVMLYFQARAIDRSGNVRTSAAVATAVDAATSAEAGWSNLGPTDYITAAPTLVGGSSDIAAGSIVADRIAATGIQADLLTSGTLRVGGTPGSPDFLLVFDGSGQEIGRWDATGLVIRDPANPLLQVRFVNGVMSFSRDGGATWTTALDGQGIRADAITLGTAPGGHNAIPNASFELAQFATLLTRLWTLAADWTATITDVGVTKTGNELLLTTSTF